MSRKVLITGGAGYIGSITARHFSNNGYEVLVVDDLRAGHEKAVIKPIKFVHGSIADSGLIKSQLSGGIEGVVHFAASLSVPESVRDPLLYWENNLANTVNMLRAMRDSGVRKILFSSTAAVYGTPAKVPIAEDDPKQPINPYGLSKLAMERAIENCVQAHGFGGIALRYFNAAGASLDGVLGEDHRPEDHLIPVALEVARGKREKLLIFGTDFATPDGTCVRDFIHVEDLAQAHLKAYEAIQPGRYDAFNVGTGRGTSVREILEAVRSVTGRKIKVEESGRREGDPAVLVADPSKLMRQLGWRPQVSGIDQIIDSAWRWFNAHPDGY